MITAMGRYFSYILLGVSVALLVFLSIVWLPLISLGGTIFLATDSFSQAFSLIGSLLWLALFDTSVSATLYTAILSLLVGVNTALIIFYYRSRKSALHSATASGVIGTLTALLSLGCASCGAVLASVLLVHMGGTGALVFFLENGIYVHALGISLQLLSIGILLYSIRKPLVCSI